MGSIPGLFVYVWVCVCVLMNQYISVSILVVPLLKWQVVPDEVVAMAERYDAWRVRNGYGDGDGGGRRGGRGFRSEGGGRGGGGRGGGRGRRGGLSFRGAGFDDDMFW